MSLFFQVLKLISVNCVQVSLAICRCLLSTITEIRIPENHMNNYQLFKEDLFLCS